MFSSYFLLKKENYPISAFTQSLFSTKESPKVVNLQLTDETLCLRFWTHKQDKWLFQFSKLSWRSYASQRVFIRQISSRDQTRPGRKSSLSIVKCLLLFTHFCRDEISSRDELIPEWKTGMRFYLGLKKRKKDV